MYIFLKNTKVGDVACCRVGQLLCTINHTELLYICQKCVYPLENTTSKKCIPYDMNVIILYLVINDACYALASLIQTHCKWRSSLNEKFPLPLSLNEALNKTVRLVKIVLGCADGYVSHQSLFSSRSQRVQLAARKTIFVKSF